MENEIIQILQSAAFQNKVLTINSNGKVEVSQGNKCLYDSLGSLIDVYWDSSKGNMLLVPSKTTVASYSKTQNIELMECVEFRHAHVCPYKEKEFIKSQKFYKPCACTLLVRQDDHILITRRKLAMNSFPGAWVLPGGHLQKGEGLIAGGLRQAQQQVGLNISQTQVIPTNTIMAWQSAYFISNRIVSSNIVIFFTSRVKQFEVKMQQTEIEEFIWKSVVHDLDEYKYTTQKKNGYGEAHLNYLSFYRWRNHQVEEKKRWIVQHEESHERNQLE